MVDANKPPLALLLTFILFTAAVAPVASQPPSATNGPGGSAPDERGDTIDFSFRYTQGDTLYLVVENEFRESGGVPPLLSYSTTIKDRRTIHQKVLPQTLRQPTSDSVKDDLVTVLWKVDRYEVAEQGMKDTVTYDSVRHLYPPSPIWELGGIANSKSTFYLDCKSGKSEGHLITLNKTSGESTRRPLSKIANKCQLTTANLQAMLNDLGPYWMPGGPVREGETWTKDYSEEVRTFGTVKTRLNCTLKSVRPAGDRRIATVELAGELTLIPATQPSPASQPTAQGVTTQPGPKPAPARQQQREFLLDKNVCKGTIEFDVTTGVLASMNLHREMNFVAKIESEKSGPMELRSGSSHIFRVKTGKTAPPKPVIVGGPKQPDNPPDDRTPPRRPATTRPSPTAPRATTRPTTAAAAPVTTRPGQTPRIPTASSRPAR
ncbi:MAG: hypothetical protein DCC65_18430 [Planctomycetota bacterium]|nr:MAG: hypothetical protein DCC65_18430 [Planctomycetota bacterium]